MKLYEIAEQYRDALDRLADPDLPADAVRDTLDGLAGEFNLKAWNVAAALLHMEGEAALIRREEARLSRRRKVLERRASGLRGYLRAQMEFTGLREVRSPQFILRVKPNPPRVVVEDEALVPERFKHTEQLVHVDKAAIRDALLAGETVDGVRLERETHLEIL